MVSIVLAIWIPKNALKKLELYKNAVAVCVDACSEYRGYNRKTCHAYKYADGLVLNKYVKYCYRKEDVQKIHLCSMKRPNRQYFLVFVGLRVQNIWDTIASDNKYY